MDSAAPLAAVPAPASPLQFAPFSSLISPSFWDALTTLKLQVLMLSDAPVPITATYTRGRSTTDRQTGERVGLGCSLELDGSAFRHDGNSKVNPDRVQLRGMLRNFNTIEDFKNADKNVLLQETADQIWATASATGTRPSLDELNPFVMITFADLKKYRYWYWCGFPALLQKPGWQLEGEWETLHSAYSPAQLEQIQMQRRKATSSMYYVPSDRQDDPPPDVASSGSAFEAHQLPTIAFLDPSTHATAPGWPLRNVLMGLASGPSPVAALRVIAFRDAPESSSLDHSRVATLRQVSGGVFTSGGTADQDRGGMSVVGWEKNEKGKLGPRMADLAPLMDPTRLADQAVDLNLQLMRWRVMPELDLSRVKNTRVLLLGAGTLGCYVARTLLAWGVRKITLVDSSTVSFSNPVRQPLFEFTDSLEGGQPKAAAAAAALKRIYPGVDATGIKLNIPMPGHPIAMASLEQSRLDVAELERLYDEHDVVYLLMDSRESRWLGTLLGAAKNKLVMNVALGFDTFLVMRHGSTPDVKEPAVPVSPGQPYRGRLGCYYCNDIVAPMDSLTDRTLDQMCTVTRPGIASIASATSVELMVSILHHPDGASAPSDLVLPASLDETPSSATSQEGRSPLGIVPHQIRGFLAQFDNLKITGQAYNKCTACSETVVNAYREEGFEMLLQAFNDASYLERLTGLDLLKEESERLMEGMESWSDEEGSI